MNHRGLKIAVPLFLVAGLQRSFWVFLWQRPLTCGHWAVCVQDYTSGFGCTMGKMSMKWKVLLFFTQHGSVMCLHVIKTKPGAAAWLDILFSPQMKSIVMSQGQPPITMLRAGLRTPLFFKRGHGTSWKLKVSLLLSPKSSLLYGNVAVVDGDVFCQCFFPIFLMAISFLLFVRLQENTAERWDSSRWAPRRWHPCSSL